MDQINEFTVPEELEDERLDAVIASLSEGQSRSYLKTLIKDGSVLLNGKAAKPSTKVRENDVIKLVLVNLLNLHVERILLIFLHQRLM